MDTWKCCLKKRPCMTGIFVNQASQTAGWIHATELLTSDLFTNVYNQYYADLLKCTNQM